MTDIGRWQKLTMNKKKTWFHPNTWFEELSSMFIKFRLQTLSVWKSLKFVVWERVTASWFSKGWGQSIHSLPYNNILDCFKLKAFADDKIYVTEKVKFVSGRVENIMGKEENAGYQHFLHFP